MSTRRSSRLQNSQSRSLVLGAKRRRVELDPDETLFLTPGSVDDQVPSEDGCSSAISSEDDVASVTDDLEQDDEAETAPPVVISSDNAPRAASLHRGSEPVEWVKTLLNKLRAHRWPVPRIVLYWLGLQGGGRGLRQTKKADKLANVLLEQEDFFSAITRHPKIQRWAVENHVPEVVTLLTNDVQWENTNNDFPWEQQRDCLGNETFPERFFCYEDQVFLLGNDTD
jgi:hypothetical protein